MNTATLSVATESVTDIAAMAQRARAAFAVVAQATSAQKDQALRAAAKALRAAVPEILAANARDLETAQAAGRPVAHPALRLSDTSP